MDRPARYHPWLIALHWLVAILIAAMLGVGFVWIGQMPATDPRLLDILKWHMAGGIVILALMAVRWAVRIRTFRPARASTGNRLLDGVALVSCVGFYPIVLSTTGTGLAAAITAGLPAIILGYSDASLPADFTVYASFVAHALLATLLASLILLHLLGVTYHLVVRRDRLLSRMLFTRRS